MYEIQSQMIYLAAFLHVRCVRNKFSTVHLLDHCLRKRFELITGNVDHFDPIYLVAGCDKFLSFFHRPMCLEIGKTIWWRQDKVYKSQKGNQTTVKFPEPWHPSTSEYIFHRISIKSYWPKKLRQANNHLKSFSYNLPEEYKKYVVFSGAERRANEQPNGMTTVNDIHRVTSVCTDACGVNKGIDTNYCTYANHLMFSSINNLPIFFVVVAVGCCCFCCVNMFDVRI